MTHSFVAPQHEIEQVVTGICQKLLGVTAIGLQDDFFQCGGHSLLAIRLLHKLRQLYPEAQLSWRDLHQHSSVAGLAQLIGQAYNQEPDCQDRPIKELFLAASPTDRAGLIAAYLKEKIAHALGLEIDQIPRNGSLVDLNLEAITVNLIWDLKGDFHLPVYGHEILQRPSIGLLAEFVTAELEQRVGLRKVEPTFPALDELQRLQQPELKPRWPKPTHKNKPMIFLLSATRSGSTLLRLMLAGHSALFCPPELSLLEHNTLEDWLQKRLLRFPKAGGVIYSLMSLMGFDIERVEAILADPTQQELPIQAIYHLIQQQASPRTLVDKTPSYTKSMETLKRAEILFDQPKYIHLVRHPYAVIESFVRNRFEKLIGEEGVDPYLCAEQV
ncbi:MAG TPA: sulfotransferase, partial [Anaerolineae bacterium]|nr:sulfotransferase [Anaerolineae bacterium]